MPLVLNVVTNPFLNVNVIIWLDFDTGRTALLSGFVLSYPVVKSRMPLITYFPLRIPLGYCHETNYIFVRDRKRGKENKERKK